MTARPIPQWLYPPARHPDQYDREYLLDVAASATIEARPGYEPAYSRLMSSVDHVTAICTDYVELEAEARTMRDQLESARLALNEAIEQKINAVNMLAGALHDALRFQTQAVELGNQLAVTQHVAAEFSARYHTMRTVVTERERTERLNRAVRSAIIDVDCDVDVVDVAVGGGR